MSMIGYFLLLEDGAVQELLADPKTVHTVIEQAQSGQNADLLDVEKAWHALSFLLSGVAWDAPWPLGFIVSGGTDVGDEDVGYGPARAISSEELAEIAVALAPLGVADLVARFDAEAMERLEIYPGGGSGGWRGLDPTNEDEFGYFTGAFEDLKALVDRGVASSMGMLVWLA